MDPSELKDIIEQENRKLILPSGNPSTVETLKLAFKEVFATV